MKKISLLFFVLILGGLLHSQNLVPNPSFEESYDIDCFAKYKGIVNMYCVKDWFPVSVNFGENKQRLGIHYHNPNQMKFGTYSEGEKVYSGKSMIGYFCDGYINDSINGIPVLGVRLNKPLKKNYKYKVGYYIRLEKQTKYAYNNFGAFFTEEKITENLNFERIYENPEFVPQFLCSDIIENTDKWKLIEGDFIAKGNEEYIYIGMFTDKGVFQKKVLDYHAKKWLFFDYYIDNVSLKEIGEIKIDEIAMEDTLIENIDTIVKIEENIKIEVEKPIILKNVYFELDKSVLLEVSFPELDELVEYLKSNNNKIEISGHTDNSGTKKHNKFLSEARAKAVADYLISQEIDANRITFFGFADSKPIENNLTEEGRKNNRRVEFKILK